MRRRNPACSSWWISLAMKSSDRRGNPLSTYATSGIRGLQVVDEPCGARLEVELALDQLAPGRGEARPERRARSGSLDRCGQRVCIAGRDEEARLVVPHGGPDRRDVAGDD